jgi:pyruvate,water dikinase
LSSERAAALLRESGPNVLPAAKPVPQWRKLLAELTHFFALMLWCAAVLAFVGGMPELGVAIIVVVVVNGIFAHIQQERAQHAAAKLRGLLPAEVSARRDGHPRRIPASELVPGDAVILSAGDRVPADVVLVLGSGCAVDESLLTGESEAVPKAAGEPAWGGTFLVNGEAEAVVTHTGANTKLAGIAKLTSGTVSPPTPLARELRRIVRLVAAVALAVAGVFFVVSLLVGIPWSAAFLFAIGVAVALVPEGLLPTVTLSLAMGAQRMAARNALVRNLEAVETLGSTTFICTDKTGTLTQNRMNAVEVFTAEGRVKVAGEGYHPVAEIEGTAVAGATRTALAARAASQGRAVQHGDEWRADGDPMEAAIDVLARRLSGTSLENARPARRFAFDPRRRRESVIAGTTLFLKGAPESVLPLCGASAVAAAEEVDAMASRGLRVIAVAMRELPGGVQDWLECRAEEAETDLVLLGLIALHDPPRPGVDEVIRTAREAGVRIGMITGDHPATAAAIAREIGLVGTPELILEGSQLPEDEQILGAMLDRDGIVVSRVSPEQKLRVAKALQSRGHIVAMTGDGVNDGPALQEADIGVAMGLSGTDVAREASDLVLLDDHFGTIVAAIEQGRATYANIHRFLTYHLTDNVAELTPFIIWALSGGQFPLALGVLQILALDIGTDLLPALALGGEPPAKGVLKRPPERRHLMDRRLMFRVFCVLGPVEAAMSMTAFSVVLFSGGWTRGDPHDAGLLMTASGAAFTAVVLGQLANAFACRSATRPPWMQGWFTNRLLLWAVLAEIGALAACLYINPLAAALGQLPPPPVGFAVAVLAIPAVFAADWAHKKLRRPAGSGAGITPPAPRRGPAGPKTLMLGRMSRKDRTMADTTAATDVHVMWFDEVGMGDVPAVGGKNASLGELTRSLMSSGVRVPEGFATTASAYRAFVAANGLEARIRTSIENYRTGQATLRESGEAIRELILEGQFPPDIAAAIREHYRALSERTGHARASVAVRSSATAEDLPDASFAGQQETFLNISGERELLEACRRCYASLFTDRAISYREIKGFDHLEVALSVGVQRMVRSDIGASGVMFSIDTESGFPRSVLISAAWGLGETVVQGSINPDKYQVFKPLLADPHLMPIIEKTMGAKERKMVYSRGGHARTRTVETSDQERRSFVLTDSETVKLARWAVAVEEHYGRPMDMEWAKDGSTGELFMVQARPETVQARRSGSVFSVSHLRESGRLLAEGAAIGESIAHGLACVVRDAKDIDDFRDGSILVTRMTDPDWVPIMQRAAGIVTDHGGPTSHAAIVSRELGVPAVVGTGNGTSVLENGKPITLSCAGGEDGQVYEGTLAFDVEEVDLGALPETRTAVMVNIASPSAAFQWWRLPAAGVGLARMEFIITNLIRIHPMALVHPERVSDPGEAERIRELTHGYPDLQEYFVDVLATGIGKIAAPYHPNPVIVRLSDFKSNEYGHLIGGGSFEVAEENPMLGFRGASRYYNERYREGFALECRALKRVREELGFTNVIVMVPFCRTAHEADLVIKEMAENGLTRGEQGLQVYMMCEIPSNVILASEFASRFDGFSIGSNDLTQLVLGVDRDSEQLAGLFDERDEAVTSMIAQVIGKAHAAGIKVGICGQGPSNHADFAEFLVREGIDSISLNPDTFLKTVHVIAAAEKSVS